MCGNAVVITSYYLRRLWLRKRGRGEGKRDSLQWQPGTIHRYAKPKQPQRRNIHRIARIYMRIRNKVPCKILDKFMLMMIGSGCRTNHNRYSRQASYIPKPQAGQVPDSQTRTALCRRPCTPPPGFVLLAR
jgi:hypothetical protein